jgi:hypothetical protein
MIPKARWQQIQSLFAQVLDSRTSERRVLPVTPAA